MKSFFFTLLFWILGLACNAQIYSKIHYYDKFDDLVKSEDNKTLVTKTDSTFIIEEKGHKPVEYLIIRYATDFSLGDKDNIVDLTGRGVYGYQDCWSVIRLSDLEDFTNHFNKTLLGEESTKVLEKYLLFIVHRFISKFSFEFQFDRDYFWIENGIHDNKLGNDVHRIIYLN